MQLGDAAEVLRVVCDEGKAAGTCSRRDEQVEVFDQDAPPLQLCFGLSESSRSFRIQAENDDEADEVVYGLLVGFGLGGVGGSVAQFRQRDGRDARRPRFGGREAFSNWLVSAKPEDARVGVEQEIYSAGGSALDRRAS
jgi:hypothetical protein